MTPLEMMPVRRSSEARRRGPPNERCGPQACQPRLVGGLACRQVHSRGPDIGYGLRGICVRYGYCGQHGGRMPEWISRRSFSVRRLLNNLPDRPADRRPGNLAFAVDPSAGSHLEPIPAVVRSQGEEMARTARPSAIARAARTLKRRVYVRLKTAASMPHTRARTRHLGVLGRGL